MSAQARYSDHDIATVRVLNPIAHVAEDFGYELVPDEQGGFVIPCFNSLDPDTNTTFSMSLVPERGMFYCAHCGEGGDVITLVEKDKKLPFAAAVAFLATRAGISLSRGEGA
ncbi:CHC2 zinc finger domain-containing protein [Nonomuraea wenchangensis]